MIFLRQSTAGQEIPLGYFLDSADGNTEEPGLTIANTDIKIWKFGATALADKNSGGGTHMDDGVYYAVLDDTDTNTVGSLVVFVHVAGALAVRVPCQVLEENIYDALFDADASGYNSGGRVDVGLWLGSPVSVSPTTDLPEVDIASISDDSLSPDGLRDTYNGVGYDNEFAPATQSQVSGIASSGGGAVSFVADGDNTGAAIKGVSFVGSQVNTFADTSQLNGVDHQINDDANVIDIVYSFDIGGSRSATSVVFDGFLNSGNDELSVFAYDFDGSTWEQIGIVDGKNGTANDSENYGLLARHTGNGADLGKVYIRFQRDTGLTNPDLNVDRLWISAVASNFTIGYANGSIWVDTVNGVAGTEVGVNGTADNPLLSWADALTLSASTGIERFHIAAGSSVILTSDSSNYELLGNNWTLDLNGQVISNILVDGAAISGTGTGTDPIFERSIIGNVTLNGAVMRGCFFEGTITAGAPADWFLNDCYSRIAGVGSPMFDFGAAVGDTAINLRKYSGGIEFVNMGQAGTDRASVEGNGQVILDASCVDGTLAVRGHFTMTGDASPLALSDDARFDVNNLEFVEYTIL